MTVNGQSHTQWTLSTQRPNNSDCKNLCTSESFFAGSSRGAQLPIYPWPKTNIPLFREGCPLDQACSFQRKVHGAVRDEGNTHLASQISQISPGDQWVTDVTLTSTCLKIKEKYTAPASPIVSSVLPLRRGHLLSVHADFCGGSVDKGACHEDSWPEFDLQSLHSGGRVPTPWKPWHPHTWTHTYTQSK